MTKADIVEGIFERLGGFSKSETAEIVEKVFEIIKNALANGEKVKISSFGTFSVRSKRQRRGRNPKTGEPIEISARKVLSFKPSQVLKASLNS